MKLDGLPRWIGLTHSHLHFSTEWNPAFQDLTTISTYILLLLPLVSGKTGGEEKEEGLRECPTEARSGLRDPMYVIRFNPHTMLEVL
jgi:hypothetical protein